MPDSKQTEMHRRPACGDLPDQTGREDPSLPERATAPSKELPEKHAPALKVLILTSRTGGGHDARARAFADWVRELYGAAVSVRIDHTLEDSSWSFAFGVNLYNTIQRHIPIIHHLYFHLGEFFGFFQTRNVRVGRSYYDRLLREYEPDVILSVHSMLNRGYFAYAKAQLSKPVLCVTYCGEFRGSYGFSRSWVSQDVDLFLGRTERTLRSAENVGLPAHKGQCWGHLLNPAFYGPPLDDGEKAAYRRDELGLEPGRFTVLLATGGAGAHNHLALLQQLLHLGDRLQVIALVGHSQEGLRELESWRDSHPRLKLAVMAFREDMHLLLQAASAVVARPGTTTSAEALQLGCPILFNRIGGAMPQELCTLRYFRGIGLAPEIRAPSDLEERIREWLDDPATYRHYRERFRAARTEDDAEGLVRTVLETGGLDPAVRPAPAQEPARAAGGSAG